MNIEEQLAAEVEKITKNKDLREKFMQDPIKTVEQALGKAMPDEELKKIVDGVKAKLQEESRTAMCADTFAARLFGVL